MNAKIGLIPLVLLASACGDDDDGTTVADDPAAVVARGRYIVDVVAVCQDCHTPRNEAGAPIGDAPSEMGNALIDVSLGT